MSVRDDCRCFRCKSREVSVRRGRRSVTVLLPSGRRRVIEVPAPCHRCSACGCSWQDPEQARAVDEAVAVARGGAAPSVIRAARREHRLTQRQLARKSGVAVRRIGAIERVDTFATPDEDHAIREALGLRARRVRVS